MPIFSSGGSSFAIDSSYVGDVTHAAAVFFAAFVKAMGQQIAREIPSAVKGRLPVRSGRLRDGFDVITRGDTVDIGTRVKYGRLVRFRNRGRTYSLTEIINEELANRWAAMVSRAVSIANSLSGN